jgi:hypothetical protein
MFQCSKCGLVGVHSEKHGGSAEVNSAFRETGELPPGDFWDHCTVLCFGLARAAFHDNPPIRKNELVEPRPCTKFLDWHPGFSPKEHIQMDIWERQKVREDARDRRQLVLNLGMLIVAVLAAVAAWWAALHPTAIPIPQSPPSATAPANPSPK